MTALRRRSRLAFATPVMLTALALAPMSTALLPTASAAIKPASATSSAASAAIDGARAAVATATAPIQVRLATLLPIAPQPGDTLVLTGSIHNASDTDVDALRYQLKLSGPIGNRGEFDQWTADPDAPLPLDDPNLFDANNVVNAIEPILAPGGSEPFRLTLTLDPTTLNLPTDNWQVRELGIAVTGTTGVGALTDAVGALRTFLPWAPRDATSAGRPTRVAWVWPLIDRPHRTVTGTWLDDDLTGQLTGTGRLANLLNAGIAAQSQRTPGRRSQTANVPVAWAIDPMLVSDVQAMTAGYRVTTSSGIVRGAGTTEAKDWLNALRGAVARPDASVVALPYADPDIVAAVRHGFATTIGLATASGRTLLQQALGSPNLLDFGWPPGGFADARAISALLAADDSTVLLSTTADQPVPATAPGFTPSAHTTITTSNGPVDTILTDSFLAADVNGGIDNPNGSRLSLQRYLSETLMIQAEQPSIQRDVVVAPAPRWNPKPSYAKALLADTGKVPWIQPVSLQSVDNTAPVTTVEREPLTYPLPARESELSSSYLDAVAAVRRQISNFSDILLPPGNSQVANYTTAEQQALSSAWRQLPVLADSTLGTLRDTVTQQMNQVSISSKGNSYVTLTSHGGKVPVTIANNLGTPVRVTVSVESNQRLTLSNNGRVDNVDIPAHQQTEVEVHAAAKTSGVFQLTVRLLTPTTSQPYGTSVTLFVRSTAYGTITLIITGAATAALMIAVAIRLTRRALAAKRGATGASA